MPSISNRYQVPLMVIPGQNPSAKENKTPTAPKPPGDVFDRRLRIAGSIAVIAAVTLLTAQAFLEGGVNAGFTTLLASFPLGVFGLIIFNLPK